MLALNLSQPERRDIAYYSDQFMKRLVSNKILRVEDLNNIVKVSVAILKLEDDEEVDKQIDAVLLQLQQVGLGDVGHELLRLISRKLLTQVPPESWVADAELVEGTENEVIPKPPLENNTNPAASKKRRLDGQFDVDRNLSRLTDTKSKLANIRQISEAAAGRKVSEFTTSFCLFHYSVVVPIMKCFSEHCNNDEEEFVLIEKTNAQGQVLDQAMNAVSKSNQLLSNVFKYQNYNGSHYLRTQFC
jgi:hypothetical protein